MASARNLGDEDENAKTAFELNFGLSFHLLRFDHEAVGKLGVVANELGLNEILLSHDIDERIRIALCLVELRPE